MVFFHTYPYRMKLQEIDRVQWLIEKYKARLDTLLDYKEKMV